MSEPHDRPTIAEIVEAVREWLEQDVIAATTGRLQFHARVAVNMLRTAERELELGPQQAADHAERLARLGVASDADLAARIRDGSLDESIEEVTAEVLASVVDKLRVANPAYLPR